MKYKNKFIHFIASNDITGHPITFKLNKDDSPKTLIGGIVSTALLLSMTAIFVFRSTEIFRKNNPIISSFLKINSTPEPVVLSSQTLPLAIAVIDKDGKHLNDHLTLQAFVVDAEIENFIGIANNLTSIPLSKCTHDNFNILNGTFFTEYTLSNSFCIDNQNITIKNINTSSKYSFLAVFVTYCSNSDENCPYEDRIKFIEKESPYVYLKLSYLNTIYDPSDYEFPIKKYYDYSYIILEYGRNKIAELFISRQNLTTDDGLFWETEDRRSIISVDHFRENFFPFEPYQLGQVNVFVSHKEYIWSRTYNKIVSLMADIMGLHEYIKFAIKLILTISNLKGKVRLINTIFEIEDVKEKINGKIIREGKYSLTFKRYPKKQI